MPLSASRQLVRPKWCPSCSLALFRAFASVCGATLPAPGRRIGGNGYRYLSSLSSKNNLRNSRSIRLGGSCPSSLVTQRLYNSEIPRDDEEFDPTPEEIKATEEEWERSGLQDMFREFRAEIEDPLLQKKVEKLEAEAMASMIQNTVYRESPTDGTSNEKHGDDMETEILARLDRLMESARTKNKMPPEKKDKELDQGDAQVAKGTMTDAAKSVGEIHDEISTTAAPEEAIEDLNEAAEEIEEFTEKSIEDGTEGILAVDEAEIRAEEEEDIEYRSTEPPASPSTTDGTPWYLQSPLQPAPRRFISPLIEQMPELPKNAPENLDALLNYLIKDLSLSKIKIMDLRGLDPTPALGPNTIMIITTARSERHMSIASDKCCRYMRGILEGSEIYADGLTGRGETKLRERRERRKGKRRTAEDEEALRVGWICVNSGQGIVVQIMTGWKREQLNLEGLWSRKIHTSEKRKLKDKLLAEGLSEDEVRERVAQELPERLDIAPEYDAHEDAIEARKIEAKLIVSEVLPPPEDPSKVGLEEFKDVLNVVEMYSKSKKRQEGKRYIDIPAVKPRKLTLREKRKQLTAVSFSTKYAFSTSARQYSTLVETAPTASLRSVLSPAYSEELTSEELVRQGKYKEVLKEYPRPRTDAQATLVLLAHLNHLILTPPAIAATTLLSPNPDDIYSTPFFKSFMLSFPKRATPTHNHIHTLVHISAHNISPRLYPIKKYSSMPSEILQGGNQVPLITYHAILRALATSSSLRGDHPKSVSFWTNRTSDTLSVMTLYVLRKMDVAGIDVGHDPEVFESLWLAMSPRDTLEYVANLGDPRLRSGEIYSNEPFSRAVDHRLVLYKEFHRIWYNPFQFLPVESSYFRGPAVENNVLGRLLHKSMQYPPENPRGRYQGLPSYLVTMFVTLARANAWGRLKTIWRWLPSKGVRRPKTLYALYFELLAREAKVRHIIEALRFLLSDYEKEYASREDVSDGIAEALIACVNFIETQVPGTGQEFGNWRRRSEAFLSGGKVTEEKGNYTYVI